MKLFKKVCRMLLIAAFWIAVWWILSFAFGNELLFPTPLVVFKTLIGLLGTASFYISAANSLFNILKGLLIATVAACLTVALTSRLSLLRELLLPLMSVIKATPVASFIVLAWIFIGASDVPSFIAVLIVFPVIWTNLDEGISKIDPQLSEVAQVYGFSPAKKLKLLLLPSLKPYFISALRTSLGLSWKAGIAAEILTMPKDTVGTQISNAKLYILTPEMFAWTLTVILFSLAMEYGLLALLDKVGRSQKGGVSRA